MMKNKSCAVAMLALVLRALPLLALLLILNANAFAQATGFTYQGRLTDGGTPANGNYDLRFQLFDSLSGGTLIGSTQTLNVVPVSAGIFSVTLDFGANAFPGANRFLDISARVSGAPAFTPLTPRQPITATPYAVRSLNTASADGLSSACNGCVTDTNIGGLSASKLTGTIPAGALPSGSGAYIQNSAGQQGSSNFNISGNGTAAGTLSGNVISATTQFNIGVTRVLISSGSNIFAGNGAGAANTGGLSNSFFGTGAGIHNQTGNSNSFFGNSAGAQSTDSFNSFFGATAGENNSMGNFNSFFGYRAGNANSTGVQNSFFGAGAGAMGTGSFNAFFGSGGTGGVTSGLANSFFGNGAGDANTAGFNNAFFGTSTGHTNLTGSNNTLIGFLADAGSNNLTYATAIGSHALVTQSNTLVLGSINGVNGATADTSVGIGTTTPQSRLDVAGTINAGTQYNLGGTRVLGTGFFSLFVGPGAGASGSFNSIFGTDAGKLSTGSSNAFFGMEAGKNTTNSFNAFFGQGAGRENAGGTKNAFFGSGAGVDNVAGNNNTALGAETFVGTNLTNATAVGYNAQVEQSNSLVLGSVSSTPEVNVGIGTGAPGQALTIQRSAAAFIDVKANNGAQELFVGADSNGGIVSTLSNHDLVLRAGGNSDKVRIRANGNVGIGTTTPNAKLQVAGGNVYIANPNSLIITSPNGACWLITVNNAGALSTLSVTCP